VIAPIVFDELDKHKYSSNKKIANRIKKLLPRIETILENKSSCRYLLYYIPPRPLDETFSTNKLDHKEQDDSLLATTIEFRDSITINDNDEIFYVTNDVGPRLKARALAIKTIKLSDDH
jgi:predicted ribonuclease YlaK